MAVFMRLLSKMLVQKYEIRRNPQRINANISPLVLKIISVEQFSALRAEHFVAMNHVSAVVAMIHLLFRSFLICCFHNANQIQHLPNHTGKLRLFCFFFHCHIHFHVLLRYHLS